VCGKVVSDVDLNTKKSITIYFIGWNSFDYFIENMPIPISSKY
jgi:hypothetical protein